jgi:hypothetical protein
MRPNTGKLVSETSLLVQRQSFERLDLERQFLYHLDAWSRDGIAKRI